jgi:hypothetical protein
MDLVRIVRLAERLSASLGVAWASGVLDAFSAHLRPFQSATVVLLAALVFHPHGLAPGFQRQFCATTQRMVLTVYAQHVFSLRPVAPDDVSSVIEGTAYACVVLLAVDLACARAAAGAEGEVLLNSAKFMFAGSLRRAFSRLRRQSGLVPFSALLLTYCAIRAGAERRALADGVCMMVLDEASSFLQFASWPYVGEFVACLLTALVPPGADPIVAQLQEYSRFSASDSGLRLLAQLPYAPTLTALVVAQLAALLPDSPFTHTVSDTAVLALFQAVLRDSDRVLHSMVPGDRLFVFCISFVLLTGLQHLAREQRDKKKREPAQEQGAAV